MSISKLLGATMIAGAQSTGATDTDGPAEPARKLTSVGTHARASAPGSGPISLVLARMRRDGSSRTSGPVAPSREHADAQPRTDDVRVAA